MKSILKKALSVALAVLTVALTVISGFAAEPFELPQKRKSIELDEIFDRTKFSGENSDRFFDFDFGRITSENDSQSPKLSNGGYDFFTTGFSWSSSDQSINWNNSTLTLTLNNASIEAKGLEEENVVGIYLPAGSTIILIGENTVVAGSSGSTAPDKMGIVCEDNLSIGGSGSLFVKSGITSGISAGIVVMGKMSIKNCKEVEAVSSDAPGGSMAIVADAMDLVDTKLVGKSNGGAHNKRSAGIDVEGDFNVDNSEVYGYAGSSVNSFGISVRESLYAKDSKINGYGGNISVEYGSESENMSSGIYVIGDIQAETTHFIAEAGEIDESDEEGASCGLVCEGDMKMFACSLGAIGGESGRETDGVVCYGECTLEYCVMSIKSESSHDAGGFIAEEALTISGGLYEIECIGGDSAIALASYGTIAINGGEITAKAQGKSTSTGIYTDGIVSINSGKITVTASESEELSCGIVSEKGLKFYCGDLLCKGSDGAVYVTNYVADNCKILASEEYSSENLTEGKVGSDNIIRVPSADNAAAKTARIYYDMNGKKLHAYAVSDKLRYNDTTRILVHCENPTVIYFCESQNESVIDVLISEFGYVKGVGDGKTTVKVTAKDLYTNEYIRDDDGNVITVTVEMSCKMSFWQKLVRFFRALFGLA